MATLRTQTETTEKRMRGSEIEKYLVKSNRRAQRVYVRKFLVRE